MFPRHGAERGNGRKGRDEKAERLSSSMHHKNKKVKRGCFMQTYQRSQSVAASLDILLGAKAQYTEAGLFCPYVLDCEIDNHIMMLKLLEREDEQEERNALLRQ